TFLATWGNKEPTRVWNAKNQTQWTIEGTTAPAFSPDDKLIAVSRNGDIEFWELPTRERKAIPPVLTQSGSNNRWRGMGCFVFASDGKTAIAHINNNWMRIYKLAGDRWQEGSTIRDHGWLSPAAFSPDGKTIAVGGTLLKL